MNPILVPELGFWVWGKGWPDLWIVSAHSSTLLCKVFLGWCPDSSEELLREVPTSLGRAKFRLRPGLFSLNSGVVVLKPRLFQDCDSDPV